MVERCRCRPVAAGLASFVGDGFFRFVGSGEPEGDELINEEEFMDIRALHCQGLTYTEIGRIVGRIGGR
jgi:hypothetical protein